MTPKQATALTFEMLHKFNTLTDDMFIKTLKGFDHIIFEGAQGFLLDENFGTAPHNTWSTTTPKNALALCKKLGIPRGDITIYGCMRTYATRHGAGPLPYEGELPFTSEELHNETSEWAGAFRTAPWSAMLLDYVLDMVKPDYISLSHTDVFPEIQIKNNLTTSLPPVRIVSTGTNRKDRHYND